MNNVEQRKKAKQFAEDWKNRGYEKGESQVFWLELLNKVLGVENPSQFIKFEESLRIDKVSGFIDAFIDKTKVLIEQKGVDKDLRKSIKQSDGSLLNPFQQAKKYSAELPYDDRPRWIVTSNFKSFLIYDMNNPNGEPEEILLENLHKEYYRLSFLIDSKNEHAKKEEELSFKAGDLVGKLYDSFSKQYKDINQESSQKSLNELCVRLVFCLYAEDADLLGRKSMFHDYLSKFDDLDQMRRGLIDLFRVLDTKEEERDIYLEDDLKQFPYVNGGLFSNENIEIPSFTKEIRELLLTKAADDFDWSEISPTIFGAVFESTLNQETRRSGGMHYTSIENIHKVIDPLFLDDLRERLDEALSYKNEKTRNEALYKFQDYISSLKFLDPACGSGNFLTETFLSLRRLENEAISNIQGGQIVLGNILNPVKVDIHQFYGIEINDFAVTVAKTALWIAESQMLKETEDIISMHIDYLPLTEYNNIVEGNALRLDWNDVISKHELNYIMGNPPFIGKKFQTELQKQDLMFVFGNKFNGVGSIDYVTGWFKKAMDYMLGTGIESALVSTNSISQGEQVPIVWKSFLGSNIKVNFAHQTFRWDSEAFSKAHVHCVIIGFSYIDKKEKRLYTSNLMRIVENINPYLIDAPTVLIDNRTTPISSAKPMSDGNVPIDGNHLKLEPNEYEEFKQKEPKSLKYIKKLVGSEEFINNKERYVLWLVGIEPDELRSMPMVLNRVSMVREFRLQSKRPATLKLANTPTLYEDTRNPKTALVIPRVSSEKRRYIPMGFIDEDTIALNAVLIIPNADLYDFGILTSNAHMAWMRTIAGRLKSDYRYSKSVVYNNFPWPNPTKEQKEKIEVTAKSILDARALYPNSSLADLYDELTMPKELRKAHQDNDKAVMESYGFYWRGMSESECVSRLMDMYLKITGKSN